MLVVARKTRLEEWRCEKEASTLSSLESQQLINARSQPDNELSRNQNEGRERRRGGEEEDEGKVI